MANHQENFDRFSEEFTKWRQEKGYPSLVDLGAKAEDRFWLDLEEFKRELDG